MSERRRNIDGCDAALQFLRRTLEENVELPEPEFKVEKDDVVVGTVRDKRMKRLLTRICANQNQLAELQAKADKRAKAAMDYRDVRQQIIRLGRETQLLEAFFVLAVHASFDLEGFEQTVFCQGWQVAGRNPQEESPDGDEKDETPANIIAPPRPPGEPWIH